jgi:orotate phosphoribosyltransferase
VSSAPDQRSDSDVYAELSKLLAKRRGHFRFESCHHGNLWLDLEPMFQRPKLVRPLAEQLAERLARHNVAAVCGPISGGAFIAEIVATALDVEF